MANNQMAITDRNSVQVGQGCLLSASTSVVGSSKSARIFLHEVVAPPMAKRRNRLIGDFMVFGGSVLYAFSNVAEEYAVKTFSRLEFLAMLGIFGSLVNGVQLVALERHELQSVDWRDWETVLCFLSFAICLFGLYSLVPILMRRTGAIVFNLSILSADFYALVLGLTMFNYKFHLIYFVGFAFVTTGLVTYSIRAPKTKFDQKEKPEITFSVVQMEDRNRTVELHKYRGRKEDAL